MKPLIRPVYPDLFGVLATPKSEELVATPYRHGGEEAAESFFLDGMSKAITNMARQSSPDYPTTIYYAFKQSEIAQEGISSTGWATFLQAVLEAGYAVVGTWPMRTEKPGEPHDRIGHQRPRQLRRTGLPQEGRQRRDHQPRRVYRSPQTRTAAGH